jgi:hypothetical protein
MNSGRAFSIAVNSFKKGESARWVACAMAEKIVGEYSPGLTLDLAKELAVSASYVRRMAGSYRTYLDMKKEVGAGEARRLRRGLTIGHFSCVGELWRRYDLSPSDATEYLEVALEEGASVEYLRGVIESENETSMTDEWVRPLRQVYSLATRISTTYGVPEKLREATKTYLQLVEEYLGTATPA